MLLASCLLLDHLRLHSYASMIRRAILSTVTETRVCPAIVCVTERERIEGCKREKQISHIHQDWSCSAGAGISTPSVTYSQRC